MIKGRQGLEILRMGESLQGQGGEHTVSMLEEALKSPVSLWQE